MKNGFIVGFTSAVLLLVVMIFTHNGASFNSYAPKLLKFEGKGFGIHQPIWGYRTFTKAEALRIHKHHYWNRYHGDLFDNQAVAEVLIDHLINAGDGRTKQNIKAFEKLIGSDPNGIISRDDVYLANSIVNPNWLVNQYVDYRVAYYKSLKNKKYQAGWLKRANAFRVYENEEELEDLPIIDFIEDAVVENPKYPVQINGEMINRNSKRIEPIIENVLENDVIEDL